MGNREALSSLQVSIRGGPTTWALFGSLAGQVAGNYCSRWKRLVGVRRPAQPFGWLGQPSQRSASERADGGTLGFGMLGFAQQEGTGRGGHTWWMLVAGEGPDEDLASWREARAALLAQFSPPGKGRPRDERERRLHWRKNFKRRWRADGCGRNHATANRLGWLKRAADMASLGRKTYLSSGRWELYLPSTLERWTVMIFLLFFSSTCISDMKHVQPWKSGRDCKNNIIGQIHIHRLLGDWRFQTSNSFFSIVSSNFNSI